MYYMNDILNMRCPDDFADEQERVQKKVFANWINFYLPGAIKDDIVDELRDGVKLAALIEVFTGDKLVRINECVNVNESRILAIIW